MDSGEQGGFELNPSREPASAPFTPPVLVIGPPPPPHSSAPQPPPPPFHSTPLPSGGTTSKWTASAPFTTLLHPHSRFSLRASSSIEVGSPCSTPPTPPLPNAHCHIQPLLEYISLVAMATLDLLGLALPVPRASPKSQPARATVAGSLRVASLPAVRVASRRPLQVVAVAAGSVDADSSADLVLVDHYKRLGVSRNANNAEIFKAFEARCEQLTSNPNLDEEAARQQLLSLEVSLDVLTSEEERRLYDWAIIRAEQGSAADYVWPFETDVTQKNFTQGVGNPPRPMTPDDPEGTAKLGYFLLAWFAVSCVLSLTLY
ncbi:unnamed protein product [Closterium sp. NIES-64]|nr:unnamed protein product [Closterium sp. NIES-64]